jgi:hypothetical protein
LYKHGVGNEAFGGGDGCWWGFVEFQVRGIQNQKEEEVVIEEIT